jgi:hypothetical protein
MSLRLEHLIISLLRQSVVRTDNSVAHGLLIVKEMGWPNRL